MFLKNALNGRSNLSGNIAQLTPRERQVLDLIGQGKTTKEIAALLQLSAGTVSNHRKAICKKLDIHSTAELVCRAALHMLTAAV